MSARIAALAALSLVVLLGAPAHARQMRVQDEPATSENVAADETLQGCSKKRQRSGGEVVGVFEICVQWYRLDPTTETDPDNDYGAMWVKARVDAKNGWCTRAMKVETVLPEEGALAKAPRPGRKVTVDAGSERTRTRLELDAEGLAAEPGQIRQGYLVRKGTMRSRFNADTRSFRVRWIGGSPHAIAVAKGVELVWESGGAPWVPSPEDGPAVFATFRQGC
ncbi:MAG TPA: hypothetical protein VM573_03345 [Actinomycetota bacterium]|jgi:hypothetical protein|nr:hypothetical protein [Actinomycetota bacterium]